MAQCGAESPLTLEYELRQSVFLTAVCLATALGSDRATAQEACTKIEAPIKRLQCYDNWARTALGAIIVSDNIPAAWLQSEAEKADDTPPSSLSTALVPPAQKEEDADGDWNVITDKSAMKDTVDVFASLQSENSQLCRSYGSASSLTLWVRCLENTTAVILSGDCHMASGFHGYGEVTYRLDEQKAETRSFDASTDSTALGLWRGGSSIPFAKSLLGKGRLIVRFTPFGLSPAEYTFNLSGVDNAVQQVRQQCGW